MSVACFESSAASGSSLAIWMKRCDVRIFFTFAASHAARKFIAPAVKFSIAGVRPIACSAKNVTTQPTPVGSMTPAVSRLLISASSLPPSANAARMMSS